MNPVPFNGENYQKQKYPITIEQSFFRLQNRFKKSPLLVLYYLTKFDIEYKAVFVSYSKTTSANLCKPIHGIIKYSTSIYPFESRKCEKEGKKLQKFEYLKNKKSFLD